MDFNNHSRLEGMHAFLGASNYHWLGYSDEKLDQRYIKFLVVQRGTELHAFAANAIKLGINLPRNNKTLNKYVNDAIGFRMTPEVILYYSPNCFGTADTISFRDNKLRIHDLKTGETKTSMHQPEIYAALFCLEYGYRPEDIEIELRIYQNDEVMVEFPDSQAIRDIMDLIIRFDKRIDKLKEGG